MKKLALALGILAILLFFTGTVNATVYECDSCVSCTDAIGNASTGDTIKLNTSLSSISDNICINWSVSSENMTLDCQGNSIEGDGANLDKTIYAYVNNITIKNCIIINALTYGIEVSGDYNNLENITVKQTLNGILVFESHNAVLNNIITESNTLGIQFQTSNDSFLMDSALVNNAVGGFAFNDAFNNIIDNITIYGSTIYGGFLLDQNAQNNTIRNSRIYDNSIGLYFTGTNPEQGNLFYNNLFNNTINYYNASDIGENFWNTTLATATNIVGGSQIGGNFWAYPNGTGYSQTCDNANNDSFCDSSYTFNPTDYIPLTDNWTMAYVPPAEELTGMALLLSDAGTGLGGFFDLITNPLTQFLLAVGFVGGIFVIVFGFVRALNFMGSLLG